jgi:hypothetical protein
VLYTVQDALSHNPFDTLKALYEIGYREVESAQMQSHNALYNSDHHWML